MTRSKQSLTLWAAVVLMAVLGAVSYGIRTKAATPESGDSPQYLIEAYHLHAHGTFSEASTPDLSPPGIGREPGYATFLAALMAIDPAFGRFTPSCLARPGACDPALYRAPQVANAALIGLAGLTLFAAVRLLTGSTVAAGVAGGYVLLNVQMHKDWYHIASDHLGLWLLTLVMLAAVWAARGRAWWRWALVGLALALLTFVKAIFLYFTVLLLIGAGIAAAVNAQHRRRIASAAAAVLVVYLALIGGWTARNDAIGDRFAFTDQRSGIALSTREVFNHMTPQQYAAAFVYWTRGVGDGLAKRLFPAEVVAPFDLGLPGGFYDTGQNGYGRHLAEMMGSRGIGEAEAIRDLDRSLIQAIVTRPFTHAATTLPVFYRGIWVDEFVVVGLPAFAVALVLALRRRQWLLFLLLGIGAFNLMFYALVSLNIPRYQMTAVPSMALATGFLAANLARRYRGRKQPSPTLPRAYEAT